MNVWRERLGRWFTPLARGFPLSPNAITVIALVLNLVAAACMLAGSTRPWLFLLSIAFITVGGLADAFDGIVARAQNKQSKYGDFLDHVCDRVSDTALAAAWLMGNGVRTSIVVPGIILVMLNGYIGTQIEATFGQRSYDEVGRGEFVLALIIFPILSFTLYSQGWAALRFGGLTVAEWSSLVLLGFAVLGVVQRFAAAHRRGRE